MDALTTVAATRTEPRRTLRAAGIALRAWTSRQVVAAVVLALAVAVLIGVPTVLIANPWFSRDIPVVLWNYPVWIATSVLAGMLAATYVRAGRAGRAGTTGSAAVEQAAALPADPAADDQRTDGPSRLGMVGGVLTWFAVGCPVCNKIALLALGYSGALTWFAPAQPYLAATAMLLTAGALLLRLRGQVFCPVPAVRRG